MEKEYILKDEDELILNGKQLREWKKLIIKDYKNSEYHSTIHRKARTKGFLEAIDSIKQYVLNECWLDPEPCCHGIRINAFLHKLDEIKKQGDKRFVIDEKHLRMIKEMLEEGYSKEKIAQELKVSISTIVYWTNPRFRKRQMEKNAKRKFGRRLKGITPVSSEANKK